MEQAPNLVFDTIQLSYCVRGISQVQLTDKKEKQFMNMKENSTERETNDEKYRAFFSRREEGTEQMLEYLNEGKIKTLILSFFSILCKI